MLKKQLRGFLYILLLLINGCVAIIYVNLLLDNFTNLTGVMLYKAYVITFLAITILTVLTLIFIDFEYKLICKITLFLVIFITICSLFLYILKSSGFLERFNSVESFRLYVSSFGKASMFFFVLLQFLQVVVLPIPSFVTVGAGVLLYGPLKCSLLSSLGIILGSLTAFWIGRKFGYKVVRWVVGESNVNKALNLIGKNDKLIFTLMFLFPFFPDDLLCFVAGLTKMSNKFFITMIFIVRIITVLVSCYSLNNNLVPYDTWWGILIWVIFFLIAYISVTLLIKYKNKKQLAK